jgi:predicted NACHT family NTPase
MDQNKFLEVIVSSFVKEFLKDGKIILKEMRDEADLFFEKNISNYLSEKYRKYSKIKTVLNGNTPVDFYDVYYSLDLIPRRNNSLSKNTLARGQRISTDSVSGVFSKSNRLTVIGDAGSGKSTLVKHLFMQALKEKELIPILIELRYIETTEVSFLDYIKGVITSSEITINNRIVNRLLKKGKFVFFLDGFDEVSSANETLVISGIDEFTTKYGENKFILTTRNNSNALDMPGFSNCSISCLSLDKGDIHAFIDLQLNSESEIAVKIKDSVTEGREKYIHSFLTNPLLLSLYILTFQNNAEIPDKKYVFYKRVIDSLYSEHDSKSKLGYIREKKSKLTQIEFEKVLKSFCFVAYFEQHFDFEFDYVKNTISNFNHKDFDVKDFIYDMTVSVSLWTEDSGIYSFAHRSLQEYFTALCIKELVDENKEKAYKKLNSHIGNFKNRAEVGNLLSLCEEMDTISYYEYYYLPLVKELYNDIFIGDNKNNLRNFILFFCSKIKINNNKNSNSKRLIKNHLNIKTNVYRSIHIHLDYTKKLHDLLSSPKVLILTKKNFSDENDITLSFDETDGLLDSVIDDLLNNEGLELVISFKKYLQKQINEKTSYIQNEIKTDTDLISLI